MRVRSAARSLLRAKYMAYLNQLLKLAFVLSTLIVSLASAHGQPGAVRSTDEIEIKTGVIFSERVSEKNELCRRPINCWVPKLIDVANLEKKLPHYLYTADEPIAKNISTNLRAYKRKYFGYMKEGHRWIVVIGICSTRWNRNSTAFQSVKPPSTDMEECYFAVDYNVATGEFKELYIDGYSS
jgi:hypothetical protein